MKEKDFDNIFRVKLQSFESPPPPSVWEGIQQNLNVAKKSKRKIFWSWISAAAVVLLVLAAAWYFNQSRQQHFPEISNFGKEKQPAETLGINESTTEQNQARIINNPLLVQNKTENNSSEKIPQPSQEVNFTTHNEIVVATNTETNVEQERVSLPLIKRLDILFENNVKKSGLRKIKKGIHVDELTNEDKLLIAENIKNNYNAPEQNTGWRMGMHISPGYASYTAEHTERYSQNMTYSGTDGNSNIGGGFSVQYKTGKRLRVESGVYYSQNGQKSNSSKELFALNRQADLALSSPEKSYFGNAVNVENGDMKMNSTAGVIAFSTTPKGAEVTADFESLAPDFSNTLLSTGEFSQVFDFVEIPLYLRYSVIDKKIGIEIIGGLNAGLVVGNNAYIDNEFGLQQIGKTEDITTLNLSGTMGLGFNYTLGKHFSVAVEPRVNYYLKSINSNPSVHFRPYRLGLCTGIYYEF